MHTRELQIGSQTLSIETGRLAKQADGAVLVRLVDPEGRLAAVAETRGSSLHPLVFLL